MLRKILVSLVALVIIAFIAFRVWLYPRLFVITGYAAKTACACTFLQNRSIESVIKEDLDFTPINLASVEIDHSNGSATASVFSMATKTARYKEGLGCVLLQGKDDFNVSMPEAPARSMSSDTLFWPYGSIERKVDEVKFDQVLLEKAIENAFDENREMIKKKTRAVLIIKDDVIVAEEYAPGIDENTPLLGWSMTKSLMNTLIGVLIKEGKLTLDQKSLFSEWENDERSNISMDNLLRMNSGLHWEEVYDDISNTTEMLYLAEDVTKEGKAQELGYPIGKEWYYSSGTSNLISGFIRNTINNDDDYWLFPQNALYDKIGMDNTIMETDESGHFIGSSYCYASARDWAKYGLLYLHDGVWNGERILPEGWVDYTREVTPDSKGRYGAHFWLNRGNIFFSDAPEDLFSANGYQGQRVFIIPSKNMVIVRLGLSIRGDFDFNNFLKEVLAAFE